MRKLLLIILCSLIWLIVANGQNTGFFHTVKPDAGGFHADYQAWLDELDDEGVDKPSASQQTNQNAMVQGIDDDGVWSKLDYLWMFAHDGEKATSEYNMIDPSETLTAVNTPTWTSDEGLQVAYSGHSHCYNMGAIYNGTNWETNGHSWGFFVDYQNGKNIYSGGTAGSAPYYMYSFGYNTTAYDAGEQCAYTIASSGTYMVTMNRTSSTNVDYYIDDTEQDDATGTATAPAADIYVGAINNGGTMLVPNGTNSGYYVKFAFSGADLTADEIDDLHNRLNTYLGTLFVFVIPFFRQKRKLIA